uniref:Uncharacterized protein n=1 Tax=Phlebotomus papatasi TaxID=29031 RepID=A0A1B0DIT5_PHLPP
MLKTSVITPIYKGDQLRHHLEVHSILSKHQYGFRPNSSTTAALHDLVSDLQSARDGGMEALTIFVDIRKAFDSVDHEILLRKLHGYGFVGVTLDWMSDYLKERKQRVQYGELRSDEIVCKASVPQGSR